MQRSSLMARLEVAKRSPWAPDSSSVALLPTRSVSSREQSSSSLPESVQGRRRRGLDNNFFPIQSMVIYGTIYGFVPGKVAFRRQSLKCQQHFLSFTTRTSSTCLITQALGRTSPWGPALSADMGKGQRRIPETLAFGFTKIPTETFTQ